MENISVSRPILDGRAVHLPASKSISNRALILRALVGGDCPMPQNVSDCDDTRVVLHALHHCPPVVDIMAAGTAMRFLTAYYSVTPGDRIMTGTERMRQRPIAVLVEALRSLGAQIEYTENEGFPPLRIIGAELDGGCVELAGNVSSQYISALLMIGPTLRNGLTLRLTGDIVSRPYIDMTLAMMRSFGATAEWAGADSITVRAGGYKPISYYIESDWSAASYWLQAVALAQDDDASVLLPGLFADSLQGDSAVARLFEPLGVCCEFVEGGVRVSKGGKAVSHYEVDFVRQPDLVQTFVVACCVLGTTFRFSGVQSLRIKETDRIAALQTELRKWGYVLRAEGDEVLLWDGERCPVADDQGIATYHDHRMAMAFAPAILRRDSVVINNPEVVSKSYPDFWEEFDPTPCNPTPSPSPKGRGADAWACSLGSVLLTPLPLGEGLGVGFVVLLLVGLIAYLASRRKGEQMEPVKEIPAECCAQHEVCERDSLLAAVSKQIEYYDDEELDRYRGREADDYNEAEVEEFANIFYELQNDEVAGWVRSLQLRGISLPDAIKDEVLLLIRERREPAAAPHRDSTK